MQMNLDESLHFLDLLDRDGRHTIASEAPDAGPNGTPKWEGGATYERNQRREMIKDIQERQARGSNVYYSVNRPCSASDRQGSGGKNNIDDIVALRALAFDIDFTTKKNETLVRMLLSFIDKELDGDLKPSMVINSGGGFQLIYFLDEIIDVELYRYPKTDKQRKDNATMIDNRAAITELAHEFEAYLRGKVPSILSIKIDNMSNIDRVMRLPGTVNYPKEEKRAKGQVPALAHIAMDYKHKCDIQIIRNRVPRLVEELSETKKIQENVKRGMAAERAKRPTADKWTAYAKAKACIDFIRDEGLADSNEWYTLNVMLPLIGAIYDPIETQKITIDEACELFMEAVSGGERYGVAGRGPGYFMRQWRSHRPDFPRPGMKKIGSLFWAAKENGFKFPWTDDIKVTPEELEQSVEDLKANLLDKND